MVVQIQPQELDLMPEPSLKTAAYFRYSPDLYQIATKNNKEYSHCISCKHGIKLFRNSHTQSMENTRTCLNPNGKLYCWDIIKSAKGSFK